MKKRNYCAMLLLLCCIWFAGCSSVKPPDSPEPPAPSPSAMPSPEASPAAYPVDVKSPFEQREFSEEECREVLEGIFPEDTFAFVGKTNPERDLRYDGPWYIFHDAKEWSYGVNPKGGKLMYVQSGEQSEAKPIEPGEAQKLAEEIIQKLAPGKFDLAQMQLTHDKFGFFAQQDNVFNWISVVDGVDIRHGACVRLDESGGVGVVFLEYNYGFDPQAKELKISSHEEAEERLIASLTEDPMVKREDIHVTGYRLTVDSQDNHRVIWRLHYDLEQVDGERSPRRASIDAMTGEKV